MIFKAYYNIKPLVGCIRITKLDKNKPIEYVLAIVHEVNGLLTNKKFKNYEDAVKEASMHGCTSSKWETLAYRSQE